MRCSTRWIWCLGLVGALGAGGCATAPADSATALEDGATGCMALAGGYPDADLAATATDCVAGGGTCCDSPAWIEVDAAKCAVGAGSQDQRDALGATLRYMDYLPVAPGEGLERVVWSVSDGAGAGWLVDACDGTVVRRFIAD